MTRSPWYSRTVKAVGFGLLVALLSSCFVLKQTETFAIGTESTRLNLVVFVSPSNILDQVRVKDGTAAARKLVLAAAPDSLSLTSTQLALACAVGGAALCAAAHLVPGVLLSWFKSDVRNRSDFGSDLKSAAAQKDCFAWTAVPGRNFTTKPPGNSGCK
ncbi:MAG: hypothetical protein KDB21_13345 [Acidimicrobiales bacterium]|nr:hypothetical protein [Planctomycetota bacterium]MCB0996076.1 hypothetical protein [Acidimicrobiales bacterium]